MKHRGAIIGRTDGWDWVFYRAAEERAATVWFTHRSDFGELANCQPGTASRGAIFAFQHNRQKTHVSPDWRHIDYPLNTA